MADKKISELTALTGAQVASDDVLAIVDTNATETKKIRADQLSLAVSSSLGLGTLATQDANNVNITGGTINATTLTEGSSPVVVQTDVGTAPNEIPLNQYLGSMAYQNTESVIVENLTVTGVLTAKEAAIGSFSWNSATNSPAAVNGGQQIVTGVHDKMRRCLLLDTGVVNYYLDPFDSTKKDTGAAADLTGADGQVMVEIPKFYTRRTVSGTVTKWEISAFPQAGFTVHPAFVKDGVEVNFRYYGAYDACYLDDTDSTYKSGLNLDDLTSSIDTANDKLGSISGIYPIVGVTRNECRLLAANRGTGWRQLDFTLWSAVQMLYLVEHQSFYSQNITGAGNTNGSYLSSSANQNDSPHTIAGASNSLGNSSTDTTSGAGVSAKPGTSFMSYRGIENFYGNCWNWLDGVIVNPDGTAAAGQGDWWFTNNQSDFSDSVRTNMTQITNGASTDSGYISAIASVDNFFVATSVSGGSSSTYITDQHFGSTAADRAVLVGGNANNGASAGAFVVRVTNDASGSDRFVGARLAF